MKFTDHVGVVRSVINAVNSSNPFPVVKHIRLTREEMDVLVHSSFMQYVYDSHLDMISRVSVDGYVGQSIGASMKQGKVNSFVLRGITIDVENINGDESFVFEPSSAGLPFGGGYYAGKIVSDGKTYAIVVAPKTSGGEISGLQWKTSNDTTVGTTSVHNGFANTAAMIAAGAAAHPAANFCNNLVINGYDDWYLPAKDELEICYRYLKPTTDTNSTIWGANSSSIPQTTNYTSGNPVQTNVNIFKEGNAEAFDSSNYYWTSTEISSDSGQHQNFYFGNQHDDFKTNSYFVHAVRRVEIPA